MHGNRFLHLATSAARLAGVDVRRIAATVTNAPRYVRDWHVYKRCERRDSRFQLRLTEAVPILLDYEQQAGQAFGHYFFQDLWAARSVFRRRPFRHLDVGSRIDGFVAHLLTFMAVEVVDIRPLEATVDGLTFIQEDATFLASIPDGSVESLSSLHAVEHFGLGRYGDRVDPKGWEHGVRALERVLAPGGTLLFSVPIGQERLHFNAHRVFAPSTVLEAFRSLDLVSFAAVDDDGLFQERASPGDFSKARNSCGLFELRKPR